MPIKYALHPNPLTENDDDHRAVVRGQKTRTTEDIIEWIARGGHSITKSDAIGVIEEYERAIAKFVSDGDRINTAIMQVSCTIAGTFEGEMDTFEHDRHEIKVSLSPGARLTEATDDLSPKKVYATKPRPDIERVKAFGPRSGTLELDPGGGLKLIGSLLKFNPDDERQGIFLVSSNGEERRMEMVVHNKPSTLIFQLPYSIPEGEYELEVRTIIRGTSEIRKGQLQDPVVIN
ncbi:DUF4469 domain-containing protein [Aliifodinibius sp. S!AR15-10]|uniref:DNA-binding domain-containing protein n=1 Tax=Aliifodinibius sp. S!AR15-10 TaxID=2950437 RepID=UPI0028556E0C|nr:DNA-binding domain-containing protein [Aliifodinibius sp. S!AR15-10]MDR8392169.1 DUF4469 domain-containing protein [Aliifodinibius sp. S!AR15-10]